MRTSRDYKVRTVEIAGYLVDIMKFGKRSFYYPQFNGDAEFEVSSKGFRMMHSYLRSVTWGVNIIKNCERKINISLTQDFI